MFNPYDQAVFDFEFRRNKNNRFTVDHDRAMYERGWSDSLDREILKRDAVIRSQAAKDDLQEVIYG